MKKLLPAFLLLGSLSLFAQSKDETAIRALLQEQTSAWNRGDVDGFMKGYWENDSLKFIGSNGITYGWSNTLANYKKHYADTISMGKLDFTLLSVDRLSDEYYYVVGKWHLKRSIGDVGGYYNLLFRKIKGEWKIIADHSS